MSNQQISNANNWGTHLNSFANAATNLYTGQRSALNTANGSKFEGEAMLTKFYNQITDYNQLNTDYSSYAAYINGFQNKGTDLKSCQFLRNDMLIFSNTICFKTVSAFADQTLWICLMGPSLCLMAICMFA